MDCWKFTVASARLAASYFLCERLKQQWVQFKEKVTEQEKVWWNMVFKHSNTFRILANVYINRAIIMWHWVSHLSASNLVECFTCPLTLFGHRGNVSLNERIHWNSCCDRDPWHFAVKLIENRVQTLHQCKHHSGQTEKLCAGELITQSHDFLSGNQGW